jgi:hypothetical protein
MATATGVTWQQGNRLLESVDYARQIVFKNGFVRVRAPDYRTSVAEGRADNQEKTFDVPANHRYEVLGAAQYNFVHSRGADSCSYILVRPSRPSAPPNIPSAADARTQLAGLTVAAQGPQTSYSRDLFPHWIRQSGTCNTRETVLKRDGTDVVTDSACTSTSRSWYSPYDDATWTAASDVDIDRMVPLSNAWKVRFTLPFPPHQHLKAMLTCYLTSPAPHPGPPRAARLSPTT